MELVDREVESEKGVEWNEGEVQVVVITYDVDVTEDVSVGVVIDDDDYGSLFYQSSSIKEVVGGMC